MSGERTIRLHTFSSIKGGVGKSTLAVVCAKLLAARGCVPVVLDCDVTGTSLADGLELCAPQTKLTEGGHVDLIAAPTGSYYSRARTMELRGLRRDKEQSEGSPEPVYLNDALHHALEGEVPTRVDGLLWRHARDDDGVFYFPSSSTYHDVLKSLDWLYGDPFTLKNALLWTLDDLANQVPGLTDVILDLPPGFWGLSHEILTISSMLLLNVPFPDSCPQWYDTPYRWAPHPFLVLTEDEDDLIPGLEYLARFQTSKLPNLRPLINRATLTPSELRAKIRTLFGEALAAAGLEDLIERISLSKALGAIFRERSLRVGALSDAEAREILYALRLEDKS